MELILASCVPRLQFPYRILPGNLFLLPYKVPARADFGSFLSKSSVVVIQPHKSEYGGLFRPLWHDLSVSLRTLSHEHISFLP
jgi:hypothetical protein